MKTSQHVWLGNPHFIWMNLLDDGYMPSIVRVHLYPYWRLILRDLDVLDPWARSSLSDTTVPLHMLVKFGKAPCIIS